MSIDKKKDVKFFETQKDLTKSGRQTNRQNKNSLQGCRDDAKVFPLKLWVYFYILLGICSHEKKVKKRSSLVHNWRKTAKWPCLDLLNFFET